MHPCSERHGLRRPSSVRLFGLACLCLRGETHCNSRSSLDEHAEIKPNSTEKFMQDRTLQRPLFPHQSRRVATQTLNFHDVTTLGLFWGGSFSLLVN